MQPASHSQPVRVLRLKHVIHMIGLSRSTIYDKMDRKSPRYDPSFPRPFKIGLSAIGWREDAIQTWLNTRIAQSAPY